jgi:hypothetical protein
MIFSCDSNPFMFEYTTKAKQKPTPQEIDVMIGERAASVEPLIDDDRLLVGLGEEVALEIQ